MSLKTRMYLFLAHYKVARRHSGRIAAARTAFFYAVR